MNKYFDYDDDFPHDIFDLYLKGKNIKKEVKKEKDPPQIKLDKDNYIVVENGRYYLIHKELDTLITGFSTLEAAYDYFFAEFFSFST
jgi:hypothetical protein